MPAKMSEEKNRPSLPDKQEKPLQERSSYQDILALIKIALEEDLRSGDVTSQACIGADDKSYGRLLLKQAGRLAGLPFLTPLFALVDQRIEVRLFVEEGSEHRAGTILGTVSGPAGGIFSAERVALNLLQHASGVATLTAQYVERLEGLNCDILDTRRTLPGLRALERYAVRVGGGTNHRKGLDDRYIIKHHHLVFLSRETKHPIREAVRRAHAHRSDLIVEVETESLEAVQEALEAEADIILLPHLPLPTVRRAVELVQGRAYVEVAGGIPLEMVRSYAETGIDGISIPALTFSAQPLEIALRF